MVKNVGKPLATIIIPIKDVESINSKLIDIIQNISKFPLIINLCIDTSSHDLINLVTSQIFPVNPQIRIFSKANSSPGLTRNLGLSSIDTDFFAFWDCDDEPDISQFLAVVNEMKNSKYDLAITKFSIKKNNDLFLAPYPNWHQSNQTINYFLVSRFPGFWRFVFTKKFLDKRFSHYKIGEDVLYLSHIFSDTETNILFSNRRTYTYNQGLLTQLTNLPINSSEFKIYLKELFTIARTTQHNTTLLNFISFSQILSGFKILGLRGVINVAKSSNFLSRRDFKLFIKDFYCYFFLLFFQVWLRCFNSSGKKIQ